MHSPFRQTALPQTTTPWLAAQATTWQMIGRCPVPISLTADAHFAARLGAFFYQTRFIWQQCTVRQYHSDLSDQSALELGLGLGLDLKLHYFSIFMVNKESEHLIFREFHRR